MSGDLTAMTDGTQSGGDQKQSAPRAMCFVAMPFGKKPPPGKEEPLVDFDAVFAHIRSAVEDEGLECVRADFEAYGGFIHRPMYERLLVAEYVVADVTLGNPNVMYEVGVRHGASARPTVLVCAEAYVGLLPFDFRSLRVLTYPLCREGALEEDSATAFRAQLRDRLLRLRRGELPSDNPLVQVTAWQPSGRIEHEKTDVFLQRLRFAGEIGQQISAALALNEGEAVTRLAEIERQVLESDEVVIQLHTALVGLFLGYREKNAYERMVDLFPRFPGELRQTPVAREQYALALNRLAEKAASAGDAGRASELRSSALRTLDQMPAGAVTSETFGIRGRIYKGSFEAELQARTRAKEAGDKEGEARHKAKAYAMLQRAIETYEQGFRTDLRDYYPGINAVTLRLRRGDPEDLEAVQTLAPVVHFAVECASTPKRAEEQYWQTATRVELSAATRSWSAARKHLSSLLAIEVQPWMHETTARNLKIQREAFGEDEEAIRELQALIRLLED